jgi:hypothetical protein
MVALGCACTSGAAERDPGAVDAVGTARPEGRVRSVSVSDSPIIVAVGDQLEWSIANTSLSIEDRLRTEWSEPVSSSPALVAAGQRRVEREQTGAADVRIYRFRAVTPGRATLTASATQWPHDGGPLGPSPAAPAPEGGGSAGERPADLVIEVTVEPPHVRPTAP